MVEIHQDISEAGGLAQAVITFGTVSDADDVAHVIEQHKADRKRIRDEMSVLQRELDTLLQGAAGPGAVPGPNVPPIAPPTPEIEAGVEAAIRRQRAPGTTSAVERIFGDSQSKQPFRRIEQATERTAKGVEKLAAT
ncbi:MAG: hypothetical protein R3B90_21705 [Planctomycetaceae bacterium]